MNEETTVVTVERRYRYVYEDVDRHGNVRIYFWRGAGHRKIRVKERIGTPDFDQRYRELLTQGEAGALKPEARDAPKPRTLRWLGAKYVGSTEFGRLDPSTQTVAKRVLDSMYAEPIAPGANETFGDCPMSSFTAKSVAILRDRKKEFPEAANARLKRLRAMFKWTMMPENAELGVTGNPARDVGKVDPKRKGGFPRWMPADLDKFEAHHPIGTQARLTLELLKQVGVRRSDLVRLGPPMVRDGVITFVQFKGRNRNPIEVSIPILPALQRVIDATPVVGTTTWLVTRYGQPFSAKSMSNVMAEWCRQAGIRPPVGPGLNNHGVRKAAATRVAERGASAHALLAMFGWLDLKQAEIYTREASRRKLARDNAHLLGTDEVQNLSHLGPPSESGEEKEAEKTSSINGQIVGWRPVGRWDALYPQTYRFDITSIFRDESQ